MICVMLSDVNLHYLTLAARCPVSGCWPSCVITRNHAFTQDSTKSVYTMFI